MGDQIRGRRCILRWVNDRDVTFLARMHRNLEIRGNWTSRTVPTTDSFREHFYRDLDSYYHVLFIIASAEEPEKPIGFFYTTQYNPADGFTFSTLVMDPDNCLNGCAAEAGLLAYRYLFRHFPLRKIYANIYEYNHASLAFVRQAGFVEEGLMKQHAFRNGKYYGLYTFALYREAFEEIDRRLFGHQEDA